LRRLAVDPVDRRLDRQQAEVIAEIFGSGHGPTIGKLPPIVEQDNARTVPSEIGIKLERARQNLGPRNDPELWPTTRSFLGSLLRGRSVLRNSVDALATPGGGG